MELLFDGEVSLAEGKSKHEIHWTNKNMQYSALVAKLSKTKRTDETAAQYKKMSRTQKDGVKDCGGFVGGYIKLGRRKAENIQSRTLLTLDLDTVTTDVWANIEKQDYAVSMYSTHTHTKEQPRLRLIIPLKRVVLPDEYQAIGRMIASDLGIDQFDDTTFQPHRLMFWPSTSSDGEYIFKIQDQAWLDPDVVLKRYLYGWKDISAWPTSSRENAKIVSNIKHQQDPTTKKNIIGAFCRTYSISEVINEFLPDIYEAEDNGRYTFSGGSSASGVVVYEEKWSYSHHGTDPASGELCNAFDLVRIEKFKTLDDKAKADTPNNRLPSFIAMSALAAADKKVRIQLGHDIQEEAFEDFRDPQNDDDWLGNLHYNGKGILKNTIKNFRLIIENDHRLKGNFLFDEFSYKYLVTGALPWDHSMKAREWTDDDDAGLNEFIETFYAAPAKAKYESAIALAFKNNTIHPVKQYLEGLVWDKQPRLENLLIDYLGAPDTEYTKFVMKKWLVAGVTRIYNPGAKFDYMLVLSGPTGIGKSTFLRKLAGDAWYTDSLKATEDKIVIETMCGKLIAEFGELAGMRKIEVEETKHFLTKTEFIARLAYKRRTTCNPIQWLYAGTTNNAEFLKDKTGNRRFWPVDTTAGAHTKSVFEGLDKERGQIWAEAMQLYKNGETIFLNKEQEQQAGEQQEAHFEIDELDQVLDDKLNWEAPVDQWHEYTFTDIVTSLNLSDRQKGYAKQNLKLILSKKGVEQRRTGSGRFYKIPPMELTKNVSDFEPMSGV
jgi:putative DNA primase/helicase